MLTEYGSTEQAVRNSARDAKSQNKMRRFILLIPFTHYRLGKGGHKNDNGDYQCQNTADYMGGKRHVRRLGVLIFPAAVQKPGGPGADDVEDAEAGKDNRYNNSTVIGKGRAASWQQIAKGASVDIILVFILQSGPPPAAAAPSDCSHT